MPTRSDSVRWSALLIALLAGGCSPLLGPPRPELSISLHADAPLPDASVLQVVVGGRIHRLRPGPTANERYAMDVRAPRTGELEVRVQLLDGSGAPRAAASFVQRFQKGHRHWVAARVGERRPLGHCIGQLIAVPVQPPLSASRADSVFLMYGDIPEDAVC